MAKASTSSKSTSASAVPLAEVIPISVVYLASRRRMASVVRLLVSQTAQTATKPRLKACWTHAV